MKKSGILIAIILFSTNIISTKNVKAYNISPESSLYITDGVVSDVEPANNLIYIGGEFSYVGPNNGYGVPVDTSTYQPLESFPYVNGTIYDVVPDGAGGWFIGGDFTEVGEVTRNRMAHIMSDGTVDPDWDPNMEDTVYALEINSDNSTLYAGGIFWSVEGDMPRRYLAAFRTTPPPETCTITGTPLTESFEGETFPPEDWETGGTAGWVSTSDYFQEGTKAAQTGPIARYENTYLKREVTFANEGELKFYWKLNTNSLNRLMLCIDNDDCYRTSSTSYYTSITGTVDWTEVTVPISKGTHSIMWKFEKGTSTVTGVDRGWIDNIRTFEYEDYPCGDNRSIVRPSFNALSFPSSAKVYSLSLTPDESKLFIGGYFSYLNNNVPRYGIASLDPLTGIADTWTADAKNNTYSGYVYAIDTDNENVYFGGNFTSVKGTSKKYYAVSNIESGDLISSPEPTNYVQTIKLNGDDVWLGGFFWDIDGQTRMKIALLGTDGTVKDWQAPSIGSSGHEVLDIEVVDGKVYVAGDIPYIYTDRNIPTNNFIVFDENTAELISTEPRTENDVRAIAFNNDNSVMYLGGSFSSVGGKNRNHIAAIDPQTGRPTDWNPNASSNVYSIEVNASKVYVGGSFASIGNVNRMGLAALDACTGGVLDWDFPIDDGGDLFATTGVVFDLELSNDNSTLYVGGQFTHLGEEARSRAGAIDLTTNQITDWNPRVNNDVLVIKDGEDAVYIGGYFTQVGDSLKQNLTAVNKTTGEVIETFNPNPNSEVRALEITQDGSILYVGGYFDFIGGKFRSQAAAIDLDDDTVTDWEVDIVGPGGTVYSMALDDGEELIYLGGSFESVEEETREAIAAVSTIDGSLDSWNPSFSAGYDSVWRSVKDIEFYGSSLFVGGNFSIVNENPIGGIVQFDPYSDQGNDLDCSSPPQTEPTSAPTPTPTILSSVLGLSLSVPEFTYPDPDPTTVTNQDTLVFGDWYWYTPDGPLSMHQSNDKVYVGGEFTYVGPNVSTGAKINKNTGEIVSQLIPLACNDDDDCGEIETIISDGDGGWYLGGEFTYQDDESLINLAHILANGTVDVSFNPNPNNTVYALALSPNGNTLYIGGLFSSVDNQTRSKLAAVSTTDGSVYNWNPTPNNSVYSIAIKSDNSAVYVGGAFTSFKPSVTTITRNRVAAISTDPTVAVPTIYDWNPSASSIIQDLKFSADETILYLGGGFTTIAGQTRNRLAAVEAGTDTDTDDLLSWNPNVSGISIYSMYIDGDTMYVGGDFTAVGDTETKSRDLAGIDLATGLPTSFVGHDIDGDISTVVADENKIYAGGYFTTVNGRHRGSVAIFDKSTGELSSMTANVISGWGVYTMAVEGNTLYVGGYFPTIGATEVGGVIRLSQDGSFDETWNPMANGTIHSVTERNGVIYVGGEFTSIGGQTQNYIAALNETNGQIVDWGIEANSYVEELSIAGCNLYVGGWFSKIGNDDRTRAASINLIDYTVNSWNPSPNDVVYTIATGNSNVYLGGEFTQIGRNERNRVAAVDQKTGKITDWNPNLDSDSAFEVYKIAIKDNNVYIGGYFEYVNEVEQPSLARVDLDGNLDMNWLPTVDYAVRDIAFADNKVYIAGEFWEVNGEERLYVAAINESDGTSTDWNPEYSYYYSDYGGQSILVSGNSVLVGGDFQSFFTDTWGFAWYGTEFSEPEPVVEFCNCRENAQETDSPNLYVVTSKKFDTPITVNYQSFNATAIAGEDYVELSGTATIPANEYYAAIPVTLIDDGEEEASEDFRIDLSDLSSGVLGWYSQSYFSIDGLTDEGENPGDPTPTPTTTIALPTATTTPTPILISTPTPTIQAPVVFPEDYHAESATQNNTASPPSCNNTVGNKPPWLYAATPKDQYSIKLYFTDADDPVTNYAIEYGTQSGSYSFAADNVGEKGVRTYTVSYLSPKTTYYFRVRAGNGCATGPWSNEISATTLGSSTYNGLETDIVEIETKNNDELLSKDTYTVKLNDTLTTIAMEQLGDQGLAEEIIKLNKTKYHSIDKPPYIIVPGWELTLPSTQDLSGIENDSSEGEAEKYTLKLTILDDVDNLIKGARVSLVSQAKEIETDNQGVAIFKGVVAGEHTLLFDYDNYSGQQVIVLQGDENVIEVTIKLKPESKSGINDLPIILIVSLLPLIILIALVFYAKRKRRSHYSQTQ